MRNTYAGGEWLKQQGVEVSPFGLRVADLLGYLYRGLYHLDVESKGTWGESRHIEVKLDREMSTFDDSRLTELVLLAHHMAIRVVLKPLSSRTVKLIFHERKRGGDWWEKHPTIQEAVAKFESECGLPAAARIEELEGQNAAAPDLLAVCEQMYRAMMAIGNDLNWDMSDCGYAPPECPQMFPVSFVEAMNVGKAAIAAAKGEVS